MNATLARKLTKILETPIDDAELLQSLVYLSNFYSVNDINGRRNLRGEIEKRNFETNQKFLQNFGLVQQELQKIEDELGQMKNSYNHMEEIFYKTKKSSGAIIDNTHHLQVEHQKVEGKLSVINKFLSEFQLTEQEKQNLKQFSKEDDNKPSELFFHSLKRVQEIYSNCKLLLRTQHQRTGLEIMEVMSEIQQTAYDHLYRWILNEFQQMSDQISPEFPIELNWALKALHERQVLLQYCLDTIIDSRSKTVFQAFIRALQHGGPNGIPKPIEIHSHDPFRYVGDMLGCLHQLLASEYELLYSLFYSKKSSHPNAARGGRGDNVISPSRPSLKLKEKEELEPEMRAQITRILSKAFESVCRPFQVRVEQVITSQIEIVTLFRLVNLFDFYHRTIGKIVAADCLLMNTLHTVKKQTYQILFDLIQKQSESLMKTPSLPQLDLSPPQLVHQTVNQLMEIMSYFDSSLVPVEEREEDFKPILNSIVDPLIRMCNLSASVLDNPSDMAVYLINCFSLIQSSLISYSFAIFKAELINAQIEAHMGTLVQEEGFSTLRKCKLATKLEIFQDWLAKPIPREPLSRVQDMDGRQLADSMRSFEASLFDLGAMVLPQCERLYSSRLKSKARSQVSDMIANSFAALYDAIVDSSNLYENPALIVPYKPQQVRTMLCPE